MDHNLLPAPEVAQVLHTAPAGTSVLMGAAPQCPLRSV